MFLVGPGFWSGGGRHSRDHLGLQPGPAGRRHPELGAGGRYPLQRHPQQIRSLVQVSRQDVSRIRTSHHALPPCKQSTQNSLNRISPGINKAFLDFISDSDSEICKFQNCEPRRKVCEISKASGSVLHPTCENISEEKVQQNSAGLELIQTDDTFIIIQDGLLFDKTHTSLVKVLVVIASTFYQGITTLRYLHPLTSSLDICKDESKR